MRFLLVVSVTVLMFCDVLAQDNCNCPSMSKKNKGTLYVTWGYNKDWFTKSDLHFSGSEHGGYNFTIENAKAHDRPSLDKIFVYDISIPQYVYRAGYFFNNKQNTGIEIAFDHTKYIMYNNQTMRLKGHIGEQYFDKDTLIDEHFLQFEHTNGANFLMANFLKRFYLAKTQNRKHWLSLILKPGAGIVIPKTDVTLFGQRLDNKFHIAGYIAGIDATLRYDLYKYFFIEASAKGVFANYTNVLTVGSGKARHHFFAAEVIGTFGVQVAI